MKAAYAATAFGAAFLAGAASRLKLGHAGSGQSVDERAIKSIRRDMRYGSGEAQTFDLYLPAAERDSYGLVVYIHGGGFRVGSDGSVDAVSDGASVEKGYRVDVDGNIEFPILGTLHVGGLKVSEARDMIRNLIEEGNYIKNPLVSIEFLNFRYTVMGAVNSIGTDRVEGDRVTLFDALARAGGPSAKAKIDKIAVIREVGNDREMYIADLRTKDVFNSPCYYLQQNDIVYVEPNKVKAQNSSVGSMTTLWFSATSILISLTSLLYNILN